LPNFDRKFDIDPAAVIEAAAESILITTTDLDAPGPFIVYANPAFERMTGWSRAEIVGKSPRIMQGPNTDFRIFANLKEKLQLSQSWEGRTLNYRKDGSEFWMEWSIVPLKNEHEEDYQYLAIQRDVSARMEVEARLQDTQDARRVAERARANLARYFSPRLVETLAAKDEPLGAVRRQNLAILFADIKGFTRFSEIHEPELVIELLRDIHGWMEKVIFKYDGSIEGYIGDAVLAIFGFPEVGEKDAGNALCCAYELLTTAQTWNQARAEEGLLPVHIGVGLQYGPVVLGDVGTKEYVEFTVIGDTVNTASRLQQATRTLQCELVVGQELVNAVKEENERENTKNLLKQLQSRGDLSIRGREQAVRIWTLTLAPLAI
jgi:PAS domain S-box-containing protein